jgi:ubiquinone/menaquinone biosynthesis C-methylase UbiE/DNA-binding transcriptional ArsR family regulator
MAIPARQPDALLSWMEVLADPTRLRLLRLLERHELGVAELCHVLQLPQSTVSRHLKVLGDQGWIRGRSKGTANLYRMTLDPGDAAARRLWLLTREQTEGWATAQQDQLRLGRLLAERQPSNAFFAGAAGKWDRLRTELYGGAFAETALLALLPPHWVIADLGCGTGQSASALAPHVRRVIGVDQSSAMLKAAQRRTAGLDNVELRRGSLEAAPIGDGECDGALLMLALTYVEEPAAVLKEMARILRPGGRAVVVDLLRHDRESFRSEMGQLHLGFECREMEDMMTAAGFAAASGRPIPPAPEARGPALLIVSGARTTGRPGSGDTQKRRAK